ncbi:SusC/RagA family TonB-linked outer membrane protein [Chitinophaga horti]|uniref:SusC/RagA family TonB-linked outer membrane protein n=1 Tax=Chitinophaga horti TaxID=2920382 RepID=A0ABY6J1K0_9BACT|nr:SusC/RagA family TonB-linked outer membrane protein [Chitinophaga horti]UYQ92512.1 SusC/RagA family TonB-linked outer membrane protein [Chitinophaga horti]
MKCIYLKPPARAEGRSFARMLKQLAILCLLLLPVLQAMSQQPVLGARQDRQPVITLDLKDANLTDIFREIRKQSGYAFLYENANFEKAKKVTVNVTRRPLSEVLQMVLDEQPVTYTINKRTIIIRPSGYRAPRTTDVVPGQPLEITGRLLDARTNEPVIGATVAVIDTKIGTVSSATGTFALKVEPGARLQISFMGYETLVTKPFANSGTYSYSLNVSQQSIKDVVVTGIFARPKQNFTGAATSFTAEDLSKVTNGNVLTALKSLDPSFQMPENLNLGSNPNALPEVVLRGGNSLVDVNSTASVFNYGSAPNVPLFILDGFETTLQRINDLDINRITKVDILKDAAATAIYGSRAANGVIVIETLRPQAGKLRVTYNGSMFVEAPDLNGYDLLNAREKLELEQSAGVYNNTFNYVDEQLKYFYSARLAAVESGVNTDWLSKPLRTGIGQKHNIYLEGGAQEALYGVNLTYANDLGVMKGSDRRTITGNTYLSYRHKNFQFRNDLTIAYNRGNESPYGSFAQYTRLNPYWTPYNADGTMKVYMEELYANDGTYLRNFDLYDNLDGQRPGRAVNPLYNAGLNTVNRSTYQNVTNNFAAQWQALSWLRLSTRLAFTQQRDERDMFKPAQHTSFVQVPTFEKGTYDKGYGRRTTTEAMVTADATRHFGDHTVFGTIGANFQDVQYTTEQFQVQGFPNPSLDQLTLGNRFPVNARPIGSEFRSRLAGYLSNLSYAYDSRYLIDLSYRLDGSSQFGAENRFAPFWSAGAGWNLHNEQFVKDLSFVNRLKLRYSYGSTGSQNFPSYLGLNTSQYFTGTEYRGVIGTYLLGYGNPSLSWQQTRKSNLGADITLFKSLIDVTANYFVERTRGSIATISLAPSSGFRNYAENMGDVLSKGFEVNARVNIINNAKSRDNWSVFVNAFHVKSTIEKVSNTLKAMNEKADTARSTTPIIRYAEGQSVNAIWAVKSRGIDPSTGLEIYETRDGKLTNNYNPLDQVIVGDARPKIEGTFGTNFELRGIGMNMFFRFRLGGQAYNQTLIDRVENVQYQMYNVDRRVSEERWRQPGDKTFFKGLLNAGGFATGTTYASSRFVQDQNELICESLSAYYRFPDALNNRLGVQNTRVTFFTGDLFRFTSIQRERGLIYPFSRTFTLQLQTSF